MTPARPHGPSSPHRATTRPEPIALAALCAPADTYAAALALLGAGYADEAHAILTSGADAGFPQCRAAADLIERNPPSITSARALITAALDAANDAATPPAGWEDASNVR